MHLQTCCRFHYPKFSNTASSKIFKETLQDRNKFSNMSSSKIFEGFEWLERNGRFQFGGLAYFRTLQVRKYGTTNGRTGRQTDRQTDGWIDKQTNGRMDGWTGKCAYRCCAAERSTFWLDAMVLQLLDENAVEKVVNLLWKEKGRVLFLLEKLWAHPSKSDFAPTQLFPIKTSSFGYVGTSTSPTWGCSINVLGVS